MIMRRWVVIMCKRGVIYLGSALATLAPIDRPPIKLISNSPGYYTLISRPVRQKGELPPCLPPKESSVGTN